MYSTAGSTGIGVPEVGASAALTERLITSVAFVLLGLLGSSPLALGQQAPASQRRAATTPPTRPASATSSGLSNQDIIKMTAAGLGEAVILNVIRAAEERTFDLSVAGLIALKGAKVSEAVILEMQGLLASPVPQLDAHRPATTVSAAAETVGPPNLPPGTEVRLALATSLTSETARVGDRVDLNVVSDVPIGGHVRIKRGAKGQGTVSVAVRQLLSRNGSLEVRVDAVEDVSGELILLVGSRVFAVSGRTALVRGREVELPVATELVALVATPSPDRLPANAVASSGAAPAVGSRPSAEPSEHRELAAPPPSTSSSSTPSRLLPSLIAEGKKPFRQALGGMHVQLKRPLHTIFFVAEGGLGTSPRPYAMPVVVVTPAGTYYEASVRGETVNDDDIQRLVNKVSTKTRSRSGLQRILGNQNDKSVTDAQVDLSSFEPGERFTVLSVDFDDDEVVVWLARSLGRKQQKDTAFRIRLDHDISDAFPEQSQVLQLMEEVIERVGS